MRLFKDVFRPSTLGGLEGKIKLREPRRNKGNNSLNEYLLPVNRSQLENVEIALLEKRQNTNFLRRIRKY